LVTQSKIWLCKTEREKERERDIEREYAPTILMPRLSPGCLSICTSLSGPQELVPAMVLWTVVCAVTMGLLAAVTTSITPALTSVTSDLTCAAAAAE
jgi:hypothetical protein